MTIHELLATAFTRHAARPAITTTSGDRLDYAALAARVDATARWLAEQGVTAGERLVVRLAKGQAFVDIYLAALLRGIVFVPVNDGCTAAELEHYVADADPRLVLTDDDIDVPAHVERLQLDPHGDEHLADAGAPLPATTPHADDLAVLLYTSGTTGKPKGAMLTQDNLGANVRALATAWEWVPDDVLVHALPLFHVHGLFVALTGALAAGAHAVMLPRFAADAVLDTIEAYDATMFMAVPTMHHRLVTSGRARAATSTLRLVTSGSAPLRPETAAAAQAFFGCPLVERYGMTEVGIAASQPLHGEQRLGTVGVALPSVRLRVVDPSTAVACPAGDTGEVQIAGPSVFPGYWRRTEQTAATFTDDGWLRSGDLGVLADDGVLTIRGRSKELIISAGFNVYPREVEECLADHPAVREVAVVGLPDDDRGEVVAAVLVWDGPESLVEDDLVAHCRAHLAAYKCPWVWRTVESLPRNAMGKVQKHTLAQQLADSRRD